LEGEILASAPDASGLALLIAAPQRASAQDFAKALSAAGAERVSVEAIGSHAERYKLSGARSGVFAP
jgi:hypothetical protein